MSAPQSKTILFLGATGGSGFAALKLSLDAGYACVAICRNPSRLADMFADPNALPPNLTMQQGDAKDASAITIGITNPNDNTKLVDAICFTIGVRPELKRGIMSDLGTVCHESMGVILGSITACRQRGLTGRPNIVAMSTTGLSKHGRDIPIPMMPLYHIILRTPHKDRTAMEDMLLKSGELATVVRASLLTEGTPTSTIVRVGIEDAQKGVLESRAIGYYISRGDVGKWIFENALRDQRQDLVGKVASITY